MGSGARDAEAEPCVSPNWLGLSWPRQPSSARFLGLEAEPVQGRGQGEGSGLLPIPRDAALCLFTTQAQPRGPARALCFCAVAVGLGSQGAWAPPLSSQGSHPAGLWGHMTRVGAGRKAPDQSGLHPCLSQCSGLSLCPWRCFTVLGGSQVQNCCNPSTAWRGRSWTHRTWDPPALGAAGSPSQWVLD